MFLVVLHPLSHTLQNIESTLHLSFYHPFGRKTIESYSFIIQCIKQISQKNWSISLLEMDQLYSGNIGNCLLISYSMYLNHFFCSFQHIL